MKINRKEMLDAARFCSAAIPAHTPDSLLHYFLFTVSGTVAEIVATDRNTQVYRSFSVSNPTEGLQLKCLLPGKKTVDLLAASSDECIEVRLTKGGVELTDSTGSYRFVTPPIDGFPVAEVLIENAVEVDTSHLNRAIGLVGVCVDEKIGDQYTLNGFRIDSWDGGIYLVGTNKTMLCSCWIADGETEAFTAPTRAVRLATKMEGRVWMGLNSGLVCFSTDNCTIISKTLLNGFPNWPPLVLKSRTMKPWSVPSKDLTEALKKCSLFTLEESKAVQIKISEGSTNLQSKGASVGKCSVDIKSSDTVERDLMVNGDLLLSFLSKLSPSLPVQLRAGDFVSISVGEFCDFMLSGMEEV